MNGLNLLSPVFKIYQADTSIILSRVISHDTDKTLLSTVHNSPWILTFSCLASGNRNYFWPHVTTRALLLLLIFIYFGLFFSHFQIIFLNGCQYSADYLRRTFCRSLSSLFFEALSPPVLVLEKLNYLSFHGFFLQLSESAVLSGFTLSVLYGLEYHSRQQLEQS